MKPVALALALWAGATLAPALAHAHGGAVGALRCHRMSETATQHCHDAAPERSPFAGASQEWCDNWRLQRCLALLGYDPGAVDGVYGPQTRAAWRSYADAFARGLETRTCASIVDQTALDCKQ